MEDFVFNSSYAEDCARVRPDWTPADGPTSSLSEFLVLLGTPYGVAWVLLLVWLLWSRNGKVAVLFTLASAALIVWLVSRYTLDDDLYLGSVGGCVGSLTVTIAFLLIGGLIGITFASYRWQQWMGSRRSGGE